MFQRSIIAGLGLMGTSLALGVRKHTLAQRYFGVESNEAHAKKALQFEAVERVLEDGGRLPDADFLALCTPPEAFGDILQQFAQDMPAHCLIIDIASVKAAAIAEVLKHLPHYLHSRYVPCHPIAGAATYGPDAADANLFADKTVIITPHGECSEEAIDRAKLLWKKLGASTRILTPEKHDRVYAYVSHLPQLLAYAFLLAYPGEFKADGLEKFLRIGGSSPQLWTTTFMLNRESLLLALEEFQMEMRRFPDLPAYGQMQAALATITNDEYKAYAGPGFRDFTSSLFADAESVLPQNALSLHHSIATLHNLLHVGDSERLLSLLKKAKTVHNQIFG